MKLAHLALVAAMVVAVVFMLLTIVSIQALEAREEARIKAATELELSKIAHGCKP